MPRTNKQLTEDEWSVDAYYRQQAGSVYYQSLDGELHDGVFLSSEVVFACDCAERSDGGTWVVMRCRDPREGKQDTFLRIGFWSDVGPRPAGKGLENLW